MRATVKADQKARTTAAYNISWFYVAYLEGRLSLQSDVVVVVVVAATCCCKPN